MPGQEQELAAAFCISEGYVRKAQDIRLIHHCGMGLPAPGQDESEEAGPSRNRIELTVVPEGFLTERERSSLEFRETDELLGSTRAGHLNYVAQIPGND